jgi:hypothetical protein
MKALMFVLVLCMTSAAVAAPQKIDRRAAADAQATLADADTDVANLDAVMAAVTTAGNWNDGKAALLTYFGKCKDAAKAKKDKKDKKK